MLDKDLMTKFEDLKNKKTYPYLSGSIENVFYYYEKTGNVKPTSECLEEARIQLEKEDK